jgi:uncharacterized protein YoaH (UPF0181 family)
MSKRYFIAPVIGDGLTPATAFRAKLPASFTGHAALIPTDAVGLPTSAWCLVLLSAPPAVHAAYAADAQVDPLPALGWEESPKDFLTPAQRTALANRLVARGLTSAQAATLIAGTLRQLVRFVGRRLHATFDEAKFGVPG